MFSADAGCLLSVRNRAGLAYARASRRVVSDSPREAFRQHTTNRVPPPPPPAESPAAATRGRWRFRGRHTALSSSNLYLRRSAAAPDHHSKSRHRRAPPPTVKSIARLPPHSGLDGVFSVAVPWRSRRRRRRCLIPAAISGEEEN